MTPSRSLARASGLSPLLPTHSLRPNGPSACAPSPRLASPRPAAGSSARAPLGRKRRPGRPPARLPARLPARPPACLAAAAASPFSGSGQRRHGRAGPPDGERARPAPPPAPPPAAPPQRHLRQHEDGLQGAAEPLPEAAGPRDGLPGDLHPRPGPGHQPRHQHRPAAGGHRQRLPLPGGQHLHRRAGRRGRAGGRQ